jgi:hypothetical protein
MRVVFSSMFAVRVARRKLVVDFQIPSFNGWLRGVRGSTGGARASGLDRRRHASARRNDWMADARRGWWMGHASGRRSRGPRLASGRRSWRPRLASGRRSWEYRADSGRRRLGGARVRETLVGEELREFERRWMVLA